MNPTVAICIATHNRLGDLTRTLAALDRLAPPPDEILVAADGCTDGTLDMLHAAGSRLRVIVHERARGSIPSRNELAQACQSDIFLSIDDDSYPIENDFIARVRALFAEEPKLAVATFPQRTDEFPESLHTTDFGPARFVGSYVNSGAAVRRAVFHALGGYPGFFFHAYEEPDFALRCVCAGWQVRFEPALTIRHHFSGTQRSEWRTHQRHARNEFWSVLLRCPRHSSLPWRCSAWCASSATLGNEACRGPCGNRNGGWPPSAVSRNAGHSAILFPGRTIAPGWNLYAPRSNLNRNGMHDSPGHDFELAPFKPEPLISTHQVTPTMRFAQFLTRVRPMELAEILKKISGIGYGEHIVAGRTWYLDPASNFGNTLLSNGTYEPGVTDALLGVLGPGDVFMDIGANEGWFSVRAAEKVGSGGKVFSMEPQARLWPVVLRNYLLNRLHNCTLVPYAVGPTEGFIDIIVYPSLNTGASSLVSQSRTKAMKRQKAGVLPWQRIAEIHQIPKVRLAKIDVEGYELEVLKSAGPLLGTQIENIFVELHPAQLAALGQSPEDVERLLVEKGYEKRRGQEIDLWTLARPNP